MLVAMAGTDGAANAGQVIDRPEKEARELVAGGYAVEVPAEKKPTPATAAPPAKPSGNKPARTARARAAAAPTEPPQDERAPVGDDEDEEEQE